MGSTQDRCPPHGHTAAIGEFCWPSSITLWILFVIYFIFNEDCLLLFHIHKDSLTENILWFQFKCCGLNGFADYGITYPASCCDSPSNGTCALTQVMTRSSCLKAVDSFWDTNVSIIKYAGLGVTAVEVRIAYNVLWIRQTEWYFFQLVAFIFACCLANQTRNSQRRQNY